MECCFMDDGFVLYQGRKVPKEGFRVFIYGHNLQKKLVKSWTEFEVLKATGNWFESEQDAAVAVEPVRDECIKDDAPVSTKRKGRK